MKNRPAASYVLAMHGAPPRDFPRDELSEFFQLHSMAETARDPLPGKMQRRLQELERRLRAWPRASGNDPFYVGSQELARAIESLSNRRVYVGFNEFCDPDLEQAIQAAIADGAPHVVVLTPMLTRGGDHAEIDIPRALDRMRRAHPEIPIEYAWPFPVDLVAQFLLSAAGGKLGTDL